jgi:hypothetical protein
MKNLSIPLQQKLVKTLSTYLHEQGFYGRVGVRKPFVSEKNKQKRLTWAKERKEWINEWESIIWSDESKFEVFGGNGRRWFGGGLMKSMMWSV